MSHLDASGVGPHILHSYFFTCFVILIVRTPDYKGKPRPIHSVNFINYLGLLHLNRLQLREGYHDTRQLVGEPKIIRVGHRVEVAIPYDRFCPVLFSHLFNFFTQIGHFAIFDELEFGIVEEMVVNQTNCLLYHHVFQNENMSETPSQEYIFVFRLQSDLSVDSIEINCSRG